MINGAAHGPMSLDACTLGIAQAFLADPAKAPDLACLAQRPRIEFASDGRRLYFTVEDRQSDILVAEVAAR